MKLVWTLASRDELKEIGRFIAEENPRAAKLWVARLRVRMQRAAKTPHAGRVVPEIEHPDIREVFLGNYRLVYRVGSTQIVVLAILEGHRLLPDVMDR